MRPDFGKCVIERPRRGSSAPSAKARWYGKFVVDKEDGSLDYDGPTRLPSSMGSRFTYDDKSFTDVLGPIEGFLRSNCGRPWDKVWSELSQLGKKSWSLRHILSAHVHVATNTYISKSGHICHMSKHGPMFVDGGWNSEFYVDPKTGLLKAAPSRRSWRKDRPDQPTDYELDVFYEDGQHFVKDPRTISWFLCDLAGHDSIYPGVIRRRPTDLKPPSTKELLGGKLLEYKEPKSYGSVTVHYFRYRKSLNKKEIQAMIQRRDESLRKKYPKYLK